MMIKIHLQIEINNRSQQLKLIELDEGLATNSDLNYLSDSF